MTIEELDNQAYKPIYGYDYDLTLPSYFLCTAFDNRFCPQTARTYRLCAMLVSRINLIKEISETESLFTDTSWFDEENNILTEDFNELLNISRMKIFKYDGSQHLSLKEFLLKDMTKENKLTYSILMAMK